MQNGANHSLRHLWVLLSIATIFATPASADPGVGEVGSLDYPPPPSLVQCNRAAQGNTEALITCQNAEYTRLDRRLNVAWVAAMRRQPDRAARLELRRLQNRWLRERWIPCQHHANDSAVVGATARVTENGCHLNIVNQRIGWLETYRR